jgi:RimJ/RimL family protein N-acetyltransferase
VGVTTNPPAHGAARRSGEAETLPGEFALRDGTPALIWPLLPTDGRALREGFRHLSPRSRRRRFLTAIGELDGALLRHLVDGVDGVHHIALVLTVLPPDGPEGPVGVARLVQDPADPSTADIAVTVADDWQGRGVGSALVAAILRRRPTAVRRIRTAVDAENRASLALLAGAGRLSSGQPHLGIIDVAVDLTAA